MPRYTILITELDMERRSAKVHVEGYVFRRVRALITDPAVSKPGNAYAVALANNKRVAVIGKPLLRAGRIEMLRITGISLSIEPAFTA
ncbi:hypothetical protein EAT51_07895 [Pseudoxanthomonas winnipegensis]|uniref:DUF7947 five-stranded beta-barrel domain-containing protein n=1 Tax=Pseudoxanthomonas winnipegensis TaxID=2480810 RepID=UPI00102DD1D7|nr:hypothetical protein [Pseudoxanthomonas winnipegensis]TAA42182.1 hypothetical protein EAT51_07895 [Pseudoxanthomonas winnipegensis]